jgi:hypothetical protein
MLVACFLLRLQRFDPRSIHVEFVVGKLALAQVSSEYFCFPCQFSFHQIPDTHYHPGMVQRANQFRTYEVDLASPYRMKLKENEQGWKWRQSLVEADCLGPERFLFMLYCINFIAICGHLMIYFL